MPRALVPSLLLASLLPCTLGAQELTLSNPKPTDPLAHARSLLAQRQLPAAEAETRQYLLNDERSASARYLLGRVLVAENKPSDALKEFTHAAGIEAPSSNDLLEVSRAYVLLNAYPDAQKWLEAAVARNPANEEAWYSLGRVRYTNQQFAKAVDAYQSALKLEPRDVRAENNLGLALDALNRTDDAITAFRQAMSWQTTTSPQPEQPMVNLATVLVRKGNTAEALPLLKRAAAIAPDSRSIREPIEEQLGHLYLQQGQLAEASAAFERALALSPQSSALHFLLGQTYRRMGEKTKADEQFRQSAELAGQHSSPERN